MDLKDLKCTQWSKGQNNNKYLKNKPDQAWREGGYEMCCSMGVKFQFCKIVLIGNNTVCTLKILLKG